MNILLYSVISVVFVIVNENAASSGENMHIVPLKPMERQYNTFYKIRCLSVVLRSAYHPAKKQPTVPDI